MSMCSRVLVENYMCLLQPFLAQVFFSPFFFAFFSQHCLRKARVRTLGTRVAFGRKARLGALEKRACPLTSGTKKNGRRMRNGGTPTTPKGDSRGKESPAGQGSWEGKPSSPCKKSQGTKKNWLKASQQNSQSLWKKGQKKQISSTNSHWKNGRRSKTSLWKKGRSIRNKRRKRTWEQERWKRRCKSREKNDKAMEVDKEEKKAAQPLEKRQEESAQSSTAQSSTKQQCCQTGTNRSCFCQWGRTWPRTQLGREEVKKKEAARKKRSKRAAKRASKLPGGGGEGWALAKRAEPAKKEGKAGWQAICQPGHQLQQQQPGTATHTTKAFKAEGHPSPAREGGAARKAATNSTTTKAFEKKAGPGLAQLLPDQGKGGGCGAQQPHQGLLGSPSRWMGGLPPQLCWQGKGGGSAAVGQKLAHQMGRHEDSDPQNRVLGQDRMGLTLQMHPCAGWHSRDSEGVLGKKTEGGPH